MFDVEIILFIYSVQTFFIDGCQEIFLDSFISEIMICSTDLLFLKKQLQETENEENEIAETRLSGNVEGKSVVIIHDVIDTGRQLKRAVEVFESVLATNIEQIIK